MTESRMVAYVGAFTGGDVWHIIITDNDRVVIIDQYSNEIYRGIRSENIGREAWLLDALIAIVPNNAKIINGGKVFVEDS